MLLVSDDGYIRLTFAELRQIHFLHFASGLDDVDASLIQASAAHSEITGYTEWLSDTTPTITIGWDWVMHFQNGRIRLRRVGEPRSNVMLQDADGRDVGTQQCSLLQEMFVDRLPWEPAVERAIHSRYQASPPRTTA